MGTEAPYNCLKKINFAKKKRARMKNITYQILKIYHNKNSWSTKGCGLRPDLGARYRHLDNPESG